MMDNFQIESALRVLSDLTSNSRTRVKTYVICSDEMHIVDWTKHTRIAVVQNTDPCSKPGTHWVLWYSDKRRGHVEYFDSFGNPPTHYGLQVPPYKIKPMNRSQFQSDSSTVCAKYCLYVFYNRQIGRSFSSILKDFFATRRRYNDSIVSKFYSSICFSHSSKFEKTFI